MKRLLQHTFERTGVVRDLPSDALVILLLGGWEALREYCDRVPVGCYACPNKQKCICLGHGFISVQH